MFALGIARCRQVKNRYCETNPGVADDIESRVQSWELRLQSFAAIMLTTWICASVGNERFWARFQRDWLANLRGVCFHCQSSSFFIITPPDESAFCILLSWLPLQSTFTFLDLIFFTLCQNIALTNIRWSSTRSASIKIYSNLVSRWSLNGIFHNFCISQFPSWFGWASWRRATTNHPYHIWSFGKDFQKNAVAKVKWMLNQFKCKVLELKRTKERIVASKREKKRASDSEAFKQLHRICFWLIVVGSFVTTKSGTGIVGSGFKRWNLYIYICGKVYFTASTQYQQADLYIYILVRFPLSGAKSLSKSLFLDTDFGQLPDNGHYSLLQHGIFSTK